MNLKESSGKLGERSKQTSDDPEWMYEQPSEWAKLTDSYKESKMSDKYIVRNTGAAFEKRDKAQDWMDDEAGKVMISIGGDDHWMWVGIKRKSNDSYGTISDLSFREMTTEDVAKYCSAYAVVNKGEEPWRSDPKYSPASHRPYVPQGSQSFQPATKSDDTIPF